MTCQENSNLTETTFLSNRTNQSGLHVRGPVSFSNPSGKNASSAEDHKELLSLECNAILLNILLFIGLLTRIMYFSLFCLLIFPECNTANWNQIKQFHAGKKVAIYGPVEPKCCPHNQKMSSL
ncbi:hypothetical protein PHYBLDRAFT_65638 [Phycomyces blakesleeanus NRRL 1555(-)]|uniref:Uncharacterized protein n=1 Tax=Phycomyces blakesleeanus (strain ATCC 8743b / DSM 1359 / FGSC 10004 / NBRC 33097 / NRRL 1555) TaxID=763407 RepID=A0A162U4Q8_PHYB8|nr:hypothetical protein PHYBLDRAFT_65638 [Phycomyces blakesleeanus NRRL 1555(-)]OAD72313.1 hypothetical protein PHYBLDRAFT_65638 [Phycomyces blakesleeanus NRRL 1555(-)]|eukprot:XP_018290353.1 hypothetical protein PHYBLDRAFT_65638 [Phycomyces blakesleeanus NRRL 1555(-)]